MAEGVTVKTVELNSLGTKEKSPLRMTGGDLPCMKAGGKSMGAEKEFQRRDARGVHDPREADSSSLGSPQPSCQVTGAHAALKS